MVTVQLHAVREVVSVKLKEFVCWCVWWGWRVGGGWGVTREREREREKERLLGPLTVLVLLEVPWQTILKTGQMRGGEREGEGEREREIETARVIGNLYFSQLEVHWATTWRFRIT